MINWVDYRDYTFCNFYNRAFNNSPYGRSIDNTTTERAIIRGKMAHHRRVPRLVTAVTQKVNRFPL